MALQQNCLVLWLILEACRGWHLHHKIKLLLGGGACLLLTWKQMLKDSTAVQSCFSSLSKQPGINQPWLVKAAS